MLATKFYYKDGSVLDYRNWDKELHRLDGPACECSGGDKYWYVDGKRHRIDGPAIEYASGGKEWWVDGKLHRIDGPAIECSGGDNYWYVDDSRLTEVEFNNHPKVAHYRFQLLLEDILTAPYFP